MVLAKFSKLDAVVLAVVLVGILAVLSVLFTMLLLQTREAQQHPSAKFQMNTLDVFPRVGFVVVSSSSPYFMSKCASEIAPGQMPPDWPRNPAAPKAGDFAFVKHLTGGRTSKYNFVRPSAPNVEHESVRLDGLSVIGEADAKNLAYKCADTQFIEVSSFPLPMDFEAVGTKVAVSPYIESLDYIMPHGGSASGQWHPHLQTESSSLDGYALNQGNWSTSDGIMEARSWPKKSFFIIPYVLDQQATVFAQVLARVQQIALTNPHPVRSQTSLKQSLGFWTILEDGLRQSFDGGTFVPGPPEQGVYPHFVEFDVILKSMKCSGPGCKYSHKLQARTVQTTQSVGFMSAAMPFLTKGMRNPHDVAPDVDPNSNFPIKLKADFEEAEVEYYVTMTYNNMLSQFLAYCSTSQTFLFFLFPATLSVPYAFRFNTELRKAAQATRIRALETGESEDENIFKDEESE